MLLGEALGVSGMIGAGLITAAALGAIVAPFSVLVRSSPYLRGMGGGQFRSRTNEADRRAGRDDAGPVKAPSAAHATTHLVT